MEFVVAVWGLGTSTVGYCTHVRDPQRWHCLRAGSLEFWKRAGSSSRTRRNTRNALRQNPGDKEARYNLEYVKNLKQQQQQQQNQDEKQEDQKEQEQQQEQNKDQKEEQEKQQPKPDKEEMSKEEAERLLEALENKEDELQEERKDKKIKAGKIIIEKDW